MSPRATAFISSYSQAQLSLIGHKPASSFRHFYSRFCRLKNQSFSRKHSEDNDQIAAGINDKYIHVFCFRPEPFLTDKLEEEWTVSVPQISKSTFVKFARHNRDEHVVTKIT